MSRVTIKISLDDETMEKVETEAQKAGWTPAMWIEWLVYDYAPPNEPDDEE